jgi:1-acyl-sn-glycerol-3-phosphate acyltransferase
MKQIALSGDAFCRHEFHQADSFDRDRAELESLDEAMAELAAGQSVLMFPEGTRSLDGAIYDFKSGVGYLALNSGCDVLPIRIDGRHLVLGKGSLMPHIAPVELHIGRLITNADLRARVRIIEGEGAYRAVADHLRATIIVLSAPIQRVRRTPDGPQQSANAALHHPTAEDHSNRIAAYKRA